MSEENKCDYDEIEDYKTAFECFKQRFLVEKKSIFNLENKSDDVLTSKGVEYLMDNFINYGYTGNASFLDKIKSQLIDDPIVKNDDKILKEAIEILATAVWLWRLPPTNSTKEGKIKSVKEILDLHSESINIVEGNKFFSDFKGFATTGTYYNVNKPTELAYIIKYFGKCIDDSKYIDILEGEDFKGKMLIKTTKDYSIDKNENNKLSNKPDNKHDVPRTVSIHNALLHLFDSKKYEPILSNDHKNKINKAFKNIFNVDEKNIDESLFLIRKGLKNLNPNFKSFYDINIRNIWQGGLDFESKNIILHGAPGTGKTYLTEQAVKSRKLIEKNSDYRLVQFHPSYGYEDFIEGIKPTEIIEESGQMKFELKNGQFKQMCIDAFDELVKENNGESYNAKTFYFIADEINRAELSRVFGELLLCLEDDKRLRFENGKVIGTKVKTPNSNLWQKKHAVVILDDKDEIVEDGEMYFGVPENIYFIGTMNDIDRSVDSFDMALRRRFVWKQYRFDIEPIEEKYKESNRLDDYILICQALNKHITNINGFNLSNAYELGQSYFMKPKPDKLNQTELNKVWKEHISPLLKEYLRAEYTDNEMVQKLIEAKKIFTLPKVDKK